MAHVSVTAIFTAKPGQGAALEALFAPLAAATRAEDGCIHYDPHRTDTADRYCIIERWASQDHLDRHSATAHLAGFREASADLVESVDVTVWQPLD